VRSERWVALGLLIVVIVGATAAQIWLSDGNGGGIRVSAADATRQPIATGAASTSFPVASLSRTATPPGLTPTARPAAAVTAPTVVPAATATVVVPTPTPAGPVKTGKALPPSVGASFIVVIDEDSGQVLYERGSSQRTAPASITKIMTALVAIERGKPDDRFKVEFDSTELVDSTLMGIHPGDEVTLEDLLYGLMLPSGNDAALAIANHIAGSKQAFVQMMNDKAQELGLQNTHFMNPHGLDETGHYTSAYDITMTARYAMQHYPLFRQLAAAKSWSVKGQRPYDVWNLNKFLYNYDGADGVKIGYTDNAGKTIVASATRKGHRVYVGLMRCTNIVTDSAPLMDWVFANYTWPN
jgi:D-alanyl-D-alanine carboxypeptidase